MSKKIGSILIAAAFAISLFCPISYAQDTGSDHIPVTVSSFERPIDGNAAYAAVEANLQSIGAVKLKEIFRITGVGQVIGIVDTGIDPLMPGLFLSSGKSKVKLWQDATGEGLGTILGSFPSEMGFINVDGVRLNVSNLKSLSGNYVVGIMPSAICNELPEKGDIYFVVYDPKVSGVFEGVSVDTNQNLDFRDEKTIYRYDRFRDAVSITLGPSKKVSVVVTALDLPSGIVCFGFDLNGHGTGLASIISGYDQGYGGVAPDAEIIAVKSVSSSGYGDWNHILAGAEYCITNGAGIVLIGAVPDVPAVDAKWDALQELAASKGVHLVIPAGNNGPGAGTLTFSDSSQALIVSSGYYPQPTYKAIFRQVISKDIWYPFSSCGPDLNGNRGIVVCAPAIAPVTAPGYYTSPKFILMEGTSAAAGYTAGALALLRQAAVRFGRQAFLSASLALEEGARNLDGALAVEQGHGKIDLNTSWDLVRRGIGDSKLRLARKWDQEMSSGDIWLKGTNLGAFPLWLDNFSVESRQIKLSSTQTWLRSQSSSLNISPIGQRDTVVYGLGQLEPGFHSAEILADDASTLGVDGRTVVSVCLPERLTEGANGSFSLSLTSGDSVVRRFIDVPESVESLELSLKGTGSGSRFVIYNPEGLLVQEGFLEDQRTVCVGLPKAGLWQICFFRDVQDQLTGGFSANVNVKFQGVCVRDLGVTGDVQTFSVESDSTVPVRFNFIGPDRGSEWRDRRSIYIPVGESSVIYLPDIEEGTESVSVRFGTTDESVLRGTLYKLDEGTNKWLEVSRVMTGRTGAGQVHLENPQAGRYFVSVEALSQGVSMAYAEIDSLVVKPLKDGQKVPLVKSADRLTQGTNSVGIKPGQKYGSARTIVIRERDDGRVLAVVERAFVDPSQVPLVQVLGSGDIKTIKAYYKDWLIPLDTPVTIGNATYQLHRGKITAPIPDVGFGEFQMNQNGGTFRFEF